MQLSEKKISIELIENHRITILVNFFAKQRCQIQMILNESNLEILFIHTVIPCEHYQKCEKSLEVLIGKRIEPGFLDLVEKAMNGNKCKLVENLFEEIFKGLIEAELIDTGKLNTCETCRKIRTQDP